MKNVFLSLFLLASLSSQAQEEIWRPSPALTPAQSETLAPEVERANTTRKPILLSDKDLLQNPALMAKVLDRALEMREWKIAEHLLNLYASMPERDETLVKYATARIAHAKGDYENAIRAYRTILSGRPDLAPVRLYLAQALFENKEYEASSFQFEKLRTGEIPVAVMEISTRYLEAIQKNGGWRWNGWVNYLDDDNINNASNDKYLQVGDLVMERTPESLPQKGKGIGYGGTIAKDFFLHDHQAITTMFQLNGKSYWNYHDFDDFIGRISIGYKVQNARVSAAVTPFCQKRFFGNSSYSDSYGTRLDASYVITPRWQTGAAWEYGINRYDERTFLDGWYQFVSLSTSYAFSTQTLVFLGADLFDDHTQEASESSLRTGIRIGIAQDLPWDISTQLQGGYASRVFKDAPSMFATRRYDHEYNALITVWNRQWYRWGVMPKLNYEYQKTSSTINLYTYEKNRFFLNLEKRF
ncbi:MAG: porin family protein [Sulfurovaceae bacterium]|nr:porin family protein [Sulfurovaceae bacterium]